MSTASVKAPDIYSAPLISTHASSLASKIDRLISRIVTFIHSLFSRFFLQKPEESKTPPPIHILQSIQKANAIEAARPSIFGFVKSTIGQAIIPSTMSWWQGNLTTLSAFAANKVVEINSNGFEYISNLALPHLSTPWKKTSSLIISAATVWIASDRLGYPQRYMFLFGIGMKIFGIAKEASAQGRALKERSMRMNAVKKWNIPA